MVGYFNDKFNSVLPIIGLTEFSKLVLKCRNFESAKVQGRYYTADKESTIYFLKFTHLSKKVGNDNPVDDM